MGPLHLKYLATESGAFIHELTKIYNSITQNPDKLSSVRELYNFRLVFIPKKDGGARPIAIGEPILLVLHKILTKQLFEQVHISDAQFAFKKNAHVLCLAKAEEYRSQGLALTTIDIKNAFNSVPHEAIKHALLRNGVSNLFISYVLAFLNERHCRFAAKIEAGVPQGDPLSMLLFCLVIDPTLTKISAKYKGLGYADDMVVAHPPNISSQSIIEEVKQELLKYGLQVQNDKCKCTLNGPVQFMG